MPDGSRCPQCDSPLSFWATSGAPFTRITCRRCKSIIKYRLTTQQGIALIGSWLVALVGFVIVLVLVNEIKWFFLAPVVAGLIIDVPANVFFRKSGTLELSPGRK